MSSKVSVYAYFARLGLSQELADIYLSLREQGPSSLMQVSRGAKIDRTRLYRLLDELSDAHLIEIEEQYKRKIYKAAPIANLQIVLSARQQEINDLQEQLQRLQALLTHTDNPTPLTHAQFYRGDEGLKQMLWNQTRAKSESLSILYGNMQAHTRKVFFERWVQRCNQNGLTFRSIVGDFFLQNQQAWYKQHDNEKLAHWQGRYVPPQVFPIAHSMVIYDDVVAYYNWKDGEVFGTELHNKEVAQTQRHFFEMLWAQGQPLENYGLDQPGPAPPPTLEKPGK